MAGIAGGGEFLSSDGIIAAGEMKLEPPAAELAGRERAEPQSASKKLKISRLQYFSLAMVQVILVFLIYGSVFVVVKTSDEAWTRQKVVDGVNWQKIQHCFLRKDLCKAGHEQIHPVLQVGCCRGRAPTNSELPSNSNMRSCYGCATCKAGYLRIVQEDWRTKAIISLALGSLLEVLLIIFLFLKHHEQICFLLYCLVDFRNYCNRLASFIRGRGVVWQVYPLW